jgi:hypothetical protein
MKQWRSFLVQFLIGAGFIFFFFRSPGTIEWIFGTIMALFLALFVFAIYANYRQKAGRPIMGVTIQAQAQPFAGLQGHNVPLTVTSSDGKMRVCLAMQDYIFILIVCFIFGPGLICLYVFEPEKFNHNLPWFVCVAVVLMCLGSTALFFRYLREILFRKPVVEVGIDAIRLMRGLKQEAVFWQRDITSLQITTSWFHDSDSAGGGCTNYMLSAVTSDGVTHALCITDKKGTIDGLKTESERMLNLTPF